MAAVTDSLPLTELAALPAGFLDLSADRLYTILPGPALIHLPGRQERPLFVSILLHGNETTGLEAVQGLLARHTDRPLPRALSLFVGNVEAARHGLRLLDGQPDYNRTWPGTSLPPGPETRLMADITAAMARRGVFASVDIHNNTGLNPHYACVDRLDPAFLQLASLFGRLVIHFTHPLGTQAGALAAHCPSVTLECGKCEHHLGAVHALEYLDACLHLPHIPDHPLPPHQIDIYRTVAQVTVREDCRFGFGGDGLDLCLNDDLDHLNFTDLAAGTGFGSVRDGYPGLPVRAIDEHGRDLAADYFAFADGRLVLRKSIMPSMLTLNEKIIRQDCFGYLMERVG